MKWNNGHYKLIHSTFEAFILIGLLEKYHVYKYKVWKIKKNISF